MAASALEVTFLPAEVPRRSRFALFGLGASRPGTAGVASGPATAATAAMAAAGTVDLVVPASGGRRLRRLSLPASLLEPAEALRLLADPGEHGLSSATATAWSAVLGAGVGLVARGRLQPTVTASGADAWRVGPLDPADLRLLEELAAAMPPLGHSTPLSGRGPLRVPASRSAVRQAWDAVADTLVRTAAAERAAGFAPFAAEDESDCTALRGWAEEAVAAPGGGGSVSLRVEFDEHRAAELDDADESAAAADASGHPVGAMSGRAVLQLTSVADPSLVVDAADLFSMPASVLARFGEEAERDLLLALRRGARVWPPLGALLEERLPTSLELDEDRLVDLLLDGTEALAAAGVEVLWPAQLVSDRLSLRAVATPSPASVTEAQFGLDQLTEFRWEIALSGSPLTPDELDALAEAKRGVVRLRGRFVLVDPALVARAAERRARRVSTAEALGALLGGTLEVDGELVEVAPAPDGPFPDLVRRLGALGRGELAEADEPPGLEAELRPYQRRGVAWLAQMSELGLGACLADDMGLGKTVQVIALHLLRARLEAGPTLVVCPTSLLGNWEREVRKFAPAVPVRRFHGPDRHLDGLGGDEIVVTSYGVLRRERQRLGDAGFALVVSDETQHAKNPLSDTARALRSLPSTTRVALTGTPVENRLTELWAILDWTNPGLLGPLERFRREVAVRVERNRDPEATERLTRIVRPFLLRRRKSDPAVAPELPERTVTDLPLQLTAEQATLYAAEVKEALESIRSETGITRQGLVLRMLTVLKQICNHPAQYLHQDGPLEGRSSKLAALDELLGVILAEGDSVLVFSQFVGMCRLIERHLAGRGVPTLFLHGGVPAKRREEMVASFQGGEVPVFLLSLKAGGVGLNLTRATHVVHYDRWWNPAVEDQASDRAHRIGQLRSVQIHRLLCEGTLEDRIAVVLEQKRALAEAVVGEGESWIGRLSDEELADLVRLGESS